MTSSKNSLPDGLKTLAENVLKLSKLLTRDRESLPSSYLKDTGLRNAYVRYFLPSNMKKVHLALADLSLHPGQLLSKEKLRVLDLGAGPGTALLGLMAYFAGQARRPALTCVAVDRVAENLKIAEDLFASFRSGKGLDASLGTVRADIEGVKQVGNEQFDLIIFSNVLNELFPFDEDRIPRRAGLAKIILDMNLAEDGSAVIIEPALRETSREMLEVRNSLLEQGFSVFSPCIASMKCPACENPRDWCHEEIPWDPPELIREIDRLTGLRKDAFKFSYVVLRKDNRSLAEMFGPESYRVVSEPLATKGKLEFYVCGRRGRKLVTRLDKDASPKNVHFDKLKRGSIAGFNGMIDEGNRFKVGQETEVIIHKQ